MLKLSHRTHLKCLILMLGTGLLFGCGGGSGGGSDKPDTPTVTPPTVISHSLKGMAVKGPLQFASVNVYQFSAGANVFKGQLVSQGTTSGTAEFENIELTEPLEKLYIIEVKKTAETLDLNSNKAPVVDTLYAVVSKQQLESSTPIYATPLTTMAIYAASENLNISSSSDDFMAAIDSANNVLFSVFAKNSTTPFNLMSQAATLTDHNDDLGKVLHHRTLIESVSALLVFAQQQSSATVEQWLAALTKDMMDGYIDGKQSGVDIELFSQYPNMIKSFHQLDLSDLYVPDTNTKLADIATLIINEKSALAVTQDSSALSNGSVNFVAMVVGEDSDNDGVNDYLDQCPNSTMNDLVDEFGCTQTFNTENVLIEAEDYIRYQDTTLGNEGGSYRTDDVDIEITTDINGGYNVGWTDPGEWLEYDIALGKGTYIINSRVASEVGGGQYSILINGESISYNSVAATGGWQAFKTQTSPVFNVEAGQQVLRVNITTGQFNLNWLSLEVVVDDDNDGIADNIDLCLNTAENAIVNNVGCPDTDQDGVFDNLDTCPDTPVDTYVDATGCEAVEPLIEVAFLNDTLVGGKDSSLPGFSLYVFDSDLGNDGSVCNGGCASNWPPLLVTDGQASGVPNLSTIVRDNGDLQAAYEGRPLYFFIGDSNVGDTAGSAIDNWHLQAYGFFGNIVPLYTSSSKLEHALRQETSDAIITMFADRGRDRHAKEDQFQQYDHYLSHYWTHRTARFKFTDYVAKGGDSILIEWVSEWKLQALEFRAWYSGMNTVAQYHGNYEPDVIEVGHGSYDDDLNKISDDGDQYKYSLTINEYRGLNGSRENLAIGQYMEVEVSQFLDGVPEGRANYYGTTYLYQVGKGGMVPWKTLGDFDDKSSERENSHPIDVKGWLGGETTLAYQYTNEPNDHYMQMATNLSSLNGQPFVLGRRIHHSSFVDGMHDEDPANGVFDELIGKAGPHYINTSCAGCHERNGRAAPAEVGEPLDKWVFKVADIDENPDPDRGSVLQPNNQGNVDSEGDVTLGEWTETNGLRHPNYVFTPSTPAKFSARIAPQLIGLGLLEAIPEEDILALEDVDDSKAPFGISGKVQRVQDPVSGDIRLGRFGYKAGAFNLKHQISKALNTDLGVKTSVLAELDCGSNQFDKGHCNNDATPLDDEHLNNLVKYIALLGVRAQRDLDDENVIDGETVFNSIGCTDCHVPTFKTSIYHPLSELRDQTIHPYSDLLLHDMGPGLADNLGEANATGAEWRTTPLWGLGLSACVTGGVVNPIGGQGNEVCTPEHSYLHDGRARTITEAILWHGGESASSTQLFEQLSEEDKLALLAFLKSL